VSFFSVVCFGEQLQRTEMSVSIQGDVLIVSFLRLFVFVNIFNVSRGELPIVSFFSVLVKDYEVDSRDDNIMNVHTDM